MAVLARRTWAQLKAAVSARSGRTGDTTFEAAGGVLEHAIADAYFDLALTFFHHELVTTELVTINTDTNALALSGLSSTLYVPICISLFTDDVIVPPAPLRVLQQESLKDVRTEQPAGLDDSKVRSWARHGDEILFSGYFAGTVTARQAQVTYYREPTAPDYSTGGSELARVWDERIIQSALAILFPAIWRFDMAGVQAERLKDFLDRSLHLPLGAIGLPSKSTDRHDRPLGGPLA